MNVREARDSEYQLIYEQGYREWAKGRSLEEYIKENQKEEANGKRFVMVNDQNQILASLMMLQFRQNLFGIGSIVVDSSSRKKGLGKKLIEECLKKYPDAAYILYSEIDPAYYAQFGFQVLPKEFQQSSKGICMICANDELCKRVLKEPIPGYF
ncbi:GNAT family N-acetyltransferase [Planococcus sp. N028]|uniref:GNAT family N-acetyltransferase n=1 Tax=Planococcus shixiaomingii TaxID=3058393 RepID=A0ABT8MYN2_9BACL|nr:GNAT family N-acetyltransferase [Planococcus sp. N028]MDN7240749.1 GNAT family N-acetyltransferase [Planococcus sp. N028]